MGTDAERLDFYRGLKWFLGSYAEPEALHTLTAFSLPAGRNPAIDDIWVFLAFDGLDGHLIQRPIEILSPKSGRVLADLGKAETVAAANADERVYDRIAVGDSTSVELKGLVLTTRQDRERLRERINDPDQTLVPNTSCATCHSFNDLTFDFHNLSHLQEMDMTIAPRVRNDVKHDLLWLREGP